MTVPETVYKKQMQPTLTNQRPARDILWESDAHAIVVEQVCVTREQLPGDSDEEEVVRLGSEPKSLASQNNSKRNTQNFNRGCKQNNIKLFFANSRSLFCAVAKI